MSTEQMHQEATKMVNDLRAAYAAATGAKKRRIAEELDWWIGRKAATSTR